MKTLEDYLTEKYSKSTLKSNLYIIRRYTDYYPKKAKTATYADVLQYIEYLRKNYDLHPKTLRHQLYGIKIYYNYLIATGQRQDHPCRELYLKDKLQRQIQVDTLYSTETLETFLATYQIRKKKHLERRNKIIIGLLIYQALTVQEIAELEVSDIDLHQGEICIKGSQEKLSKRPRSRTLPLQAKQILKMLEYVKNDRPRLLKYNKDKAEHRFILGQYGTGINPHGISKIINDNRNQNEILLPMRIRQSVIANLLKKENDVRIVQVFAGHKRASTTEQYRMNALEVLQMAVKKYHPIQ